MGVLESVEIVRCRSLQRIACLSEQLLLHPLALSHSNRLHCQNSLIPHPSSGDRMANSCCSLLARTCRGKTYTRAVVMVPGHHPGATRTELTWAHTIMCALPKRFLCKVLGRSGSSCKL